MNKISLMLLATSVATASFAEPSVDRVLVRQMWPWSGKVKIEYELSGNDYAADLTVEAFAKGRKLNTESFRNALKGDLFGVSGNGVHMLEFDPADLSELTSVSAEFSVKISATESAPGSADVHYRIFDLVTGEVTDVRPCDFASGNRKFPGTPLTDYKWIDEENGKYSTELEQTFIWKDANYAKNDPDDGLNPYKTTKLLMRRIPAANVTWQMGSPETEANRGADETQHAVKFMKDFWIGVYKVTQYQWYLLMNGDRSKGYYKNEAYWKQRPVDSASWNHIRGSNAKWPGDDGAPSYAVEDSSFLKALRDRFGGGYRFDLPTEAQWEFACRGGNSCAYFLGPSFTNEADFYYRITRTEWNCNGGYGANVDTSGGTVGVGAYRPNAYGLYEMVGQMFEWCLDWYAADYAVSQDVATDPVGPQTGEKRCARGRNAANLTPGNGQLRSAYRSSFAPSTTMRGAWDGGYGTFGFRVCITEE